MITRGRWGLVRLRTVVRLRAVAAALAMVAVAGCSSPVAIPATESARAAGGAGYWTLARLLSARAWRAGDRATGAPARKGVSSSAHTALVATRVGALFVRDSGGDHFCTASVVSSPGRDLLITAAHCINGGDGGGYRSDIVFVPDYRDGVAPYGIWAPARLLVAPGWASSADPDLDVGFVVLEPHDGRDIEQVLGANTLLFDPGYRNLVRVTGYPQSSDEPITCKNWTTEQSATQLKFSCDGFTGGTSGSPWITGFDPATRTGRIVGVLGGYQQGGDTANVSYSAYLGAAVRQLYDQAIAG
jgi:V8-like Glu-specific endopeptidase